jgi:hypothetical protein
LLIILLLSPLGAQIPESRLSFAYTGIEFTNTKQFSSTEIELLNSRLSSYLLELARQEDYSLTAPRNAEELRHNALVSPDRYRSWLAGNRQPTSQGLIALRINRDNGLALEAYLIDPASGEILLSTNRTYPDFDSLLEESRSQIFELFGLSAPVIGTIVQLSPSNSANVGRLSSVTMQDIIGRWQGDFSLGEITIESDGRAIAKLANNATMRLQVRIDTGKIIISQDEPNSPKLYLDSFPLDIANQITRVARPISWEFFLSLRKDQLVGRKNTSAFTIEKGRIIQTDNSYSRDAVWTRTP